MFGQLQEADEESIELRLLTEPSFMEEFDTVVDEVTDQYLRNELPDSDRAGFEKSFLTTSEGKTKLRFASELLERAAAERGVAAAQPTVEKNRESGFFDLITSFWQSQSLRLAATATAVVIIAGGIFLISKSFYFGSTDYASLNLSINTSTRAEGSAPPRVKLESGMAGIQLNLAIPEQERGAKDYLLRLVSGDGSQRDLPVDQRNDQTVIVKIPASSLARGTYAIQMSSVKPDGTHQRITGSYYFDID